MAQRKIIILDKAVEEIAAVAYFIESKGIPDTAKKFVDAVFSSIEKINNPKVKHRPCVHEVWRIQGLSCIPFRKSFMIAYLDDEKEIIICDFAIQKNLF